MDLAQERGASTWLTILPLEEFGLTLHKGAFRDAIALRYGWQPALIPSTCACGTSFSVEHALSCPMGRFPIVRHNEVRDLTAKLMSEVYHDVCIEPTLQPITGEALSGASAITEDGARLDVAANGFWGGRFDVTPMLHQTDNLFPPATENTKTSRNWPTNREFGKSSTAPSLPSSCPLLLGWEAPPPPATRGLPLSALFQTGTALLQYYGLDQLQPVILSSSLVNPVHKRCPLCCRPCIQTTHSTH